MGFNRLKLNSNILQHNVSPNFSEAKSLIEKNDFDKFVNFLNNYKIDINDLGEENGFSLLMLATQFGNIKVVRELIQREVDVNYQNSDNWNALLITVKENNLDILNDLLDAGADIESYDCAGFTALMWASYQGNLDLVKVLLKRNANPNVYDLNHISPLIWASGRGFIKIVVLLIGHGAKVDSVDKYGTTPLIWASRKGYLEIVKKLLKAGAHVDATGMFGWTSLIVATRGNYVEVVEHLLKFKPNINACDAQGMTPLMTASKEGNIEIVNLLLHNNAFVNISDKNGDTSLIHACKSDHLFVVEALLKEHAAIDHQGDDRKTALYCSVEKGHINIIKALLKVHPNLELSTKDGDTPLLKAVRNRKLEILKMLVDRKAKISCVDKNGDTVLHIAARSQSKAILEFILRNPHNSQLLYKPNKNLETPFALDNSHQKPILPTLFGAAPSNRRVLEKETQLGYDLYSSAIANLLTEPSLKTPICIGFFAKWGSGKSFLLGKLKEELLSFTKEWLINYNLKFTFTIGLLIIMISAMVGFLTLIVSTGNVYLSISAMIISLVLMYITFLIIYFGNHKYHWEFTFSLKNKLNRLKLILQICFGNPPLLDYDQISSNPVRFLFTETPIKISTDYNVSQLISEIHRALWNSIGEKNGHFSIKLFKVFQPKPVSSTNWKWRRICGVIPTIFLLIVMFFAILLGVSFIIIENQLVNIFDKHPILSYIIVGILSVAGAWILANIIVPFKIIRELLFPPKFKTSEELKKEVELLQLCVNCLDAFNGKSQTRLVIILDALESIYESDRLMSFLEAININFLSTKTTKYFSVPFIIIFTLDPHHHVTAKSKEYLRTIVHLPFFLQNSQLRRVKVAQQTIAKSLNDIKNSTTSLVEAISQAPISLSDSYKFGSTGSTKQKNRHKKNGSLLKSSDSIVSLCGSGFATGGSGEVPKRVLLTDDYFSDVNPKSMRRIMNIVYIQGRLLKAFNLEFSWHKLTTWVNITEQWPFRAASLIVFYEMNESKYIDDAIPLKMVYDKVNNILGINKDIQYTLHHNKDSDEKKLNAFLSNLHNSLTLSDLKIFAPFAINLDPYIRKQVQEIFNNNQLFSLIANRPLSPTNPNCNQSMQYSFYNEENKSSKLSTLSVDDVISLLKQIEGFNISMIDKYASIIKLHNINGKVLDSCSFKDLEELKKILKFTFGDWLLFKKMITENKQLVHLHTLAPANVITSPIPSIKPYAPSSDIHNLENYIGTPNLITNDLVIDRKFIKNNQQKLNSNYILVPRLQSNIEKQVTMEETTLQSDIVEDDEETEQIYTSTDSFNKNSSNELDVLYIMNTPLKVSSSASLTEDTNYGNEFNFSYVLNMESEPNDKTPLVSPKRSCNSGSSDGSSNERRKLERQKKFDAKETIF